MKVVLLTGNKNKVLEAESILGVKLEHYNLDLEEIQSLDPKKVVEHKIKKAYEILRKPVIVWDVSVEFSALNSAPGALIKFFWEPIGLKKVCEIIKGLGDNSVTARLVLGYHDGYETYYFEGVTEGTIPEEPRGTNGFAWDQIFIPLGESRTFAEMSLEEKNKHSMQGKALIKFKQFLDSQGLVDQR